jgi:hypothetical protein
MFTPELREQVQMFIDGKIGVEQLEDWLTPKLHQFVQDINSEDADLIAAIELGLADLSHGDQTEEELGIYLADVLKEPDISIIYSMNNPIITSGSNLLQTHYGAWVDNQVIYEVIWVNQAVSAV